ncbi:MAG: deoxyribodipyrimidine photo-lyase, partial [Candidatus Phosphoribacter baldrii]
MTSVWWARRDLRVADHPALLAAAASGGHVVPLFVIDPAVWA